MAKLIWKNGEVCIRKGARPRLSALFAGDLCPRLRTETLVCAGHARDVVEAMLPVLRDKDLSIVNLEAPLTEGGTPIQKSGPNIRAMPRSVELLTTMGFDIASLANNHIGDYGVAQVTKTIDRLQAAGIATVGAGKNLAAASCPLYVKRQGVRVAVIAIAEYEFGMATDRAAGAAPLSVPENLRTIRAASAKSDMTIVFVHGGNETNPVPNPYMIETYRAFADAGASAVVSAHTHCPQGIEVYNGVPIVYGLGNLLFDTTDAPAGSLWWTGYAVKIAFDGKKAVSLQAIPHTFAPDATRIRPLAGRARDAFLDYLSRLSDIIADRKEANACWEAWCAKMGPSWLTFLGGAAHLPAEMTDEALRRLPPARNVCTCDAHRHLIKDYLRMLCEGRLEEAKKGIPRIEALQTMQFPQQGRQGGV